MVVAWAVFVAVSLGFPLFQLGGASWGLILLLLFALEWGYAFAPYDALVRSLLRAADVLPFGYGVGLVTMLVTARLQRLGDLAAGTMVIREPRYKLQRETPDLEGAARLTAEDIDAAWRPA